MPGTPQFDLPAVPQNKNKIKGGDPVRPLYLSSFISGSMLRLLVLRRNSLCQQGIALKGSSIFNFVQYQFDKLKL